MYSTEGEDYYESDHEVKFLETIPEAKRVAKGKAVFIVPDKDKLETPEERAKRRNEMIAKLLEETTGELDVDNVYMTE